MVLDDKTYFSLMLIIPFVVVLYLSVVLWKKKAQKRFASEEMLQRLSPSKSVFKPFLKLMLLCIAIACIALALVNPKIGTKLETVKREGVDIVFAIDVSKSMLAEDVAPNRLEKSKRIVSEIINSLDSDRIGFIAYAAQAFPVLPITTDYGAARMFLQSMNTNMLSSQGTAISDAIEMAKTYFNDNEQTNRFLFIVSDGEDHEGNVEQAVEKAVAEGIRVYSIGIGTVQGGPIPEKINGVTGSFKKDRNGDVVITRLDERTLRTIASGGNGNYFLGNQTEKAIEAVKDILNKADKQEFESKQLADFKDQFQWFLAAAIFFLFIDIFVLERKTAWLQKLNLFNEKVS